MHEIVKCSCGALIRQCRCFHKDKLVRVIENGCDSCAQLVEDRHLVVAFEVSAELARRYRGTRQAEFIGLESRPFIESLLEACKQHNVTPNRYRITIEAIPEPV